MRTNLQPPVGFEPVTTKVISIKSTPIDKGYKDAIVMNDTFTPISDLLKATTCSGNLPRKLKARQAAVVPVAIPGLVALWTLQNENVDPSPEALFTKAKEIAAQLELPESVVSPENITEFLTHIGYEISPVAAVLGGFLGQEILHFLSQKYNRNFPFNNFYVFQMSNFPNRIYCLR